MNRRIILLTLVLIMFLAACGRSALDENGGSPAATAPSSEPTATLPPPVVVESSDGQPQPQEPAAPEPTQPVGPTSPWPWPADAFGFGVQSHAVVGDPRVTMETISQQLGMEWVKVQLEWPLVEPDPGLYQWFFYDGAVDEAYNHGLRLMFSVVGAPAWTRSTGDENGPPDDYNLYANFLTALLNQYPGKIHAIEVWNEQNLDREWKSAAGIAPENYIDFLSRAHAAIKAYDPNIIVISGALAPTGVSDGITVLDDFVYLDQALAGGLLKYADCVGVHHNGYNIGPDVAYDQTGSLPEAATAIFRGPFDNVHHSWSFKTTLDTYAEKINAVDPTKKLCVTEFGWASNEGYDSYPTNFEFVQDNTLEEQATYIVQAFQQMKASGDVWLAFLFNFDFGNKGNGPTDDPVPYSIVDLAGAPRPAFSAVAEMAKDR